MSFTSLFVLFKRGRWLLAMSYLGMHVVVDVGSGQLPLDLHDFLQSLSDRVGGSDGQE